MRVKYSLVAISLMFLAATVGTVSASSSALADKYLKKLNVLETKVSATDGVQDMSDVTNNTYNPYVEISGQRFLKTKSASKSAFGYDLFVPLWQNHNSLLFTDARLYDRAGKTIEGKLHLGYRYLSPKQNYLYGAYVAFDRNRSERGNYFSQVTFGAEGWFQQIYLEGNVYVPVGKNAKCINPVTSVIDYKPEGDKIATCDGLYEKALSGSDITVGYEVMPGLVGKIGGYYFGSKNVDTIYGPRITLAYNLLPKAGKRVLSVFDKVGFEFGAQNDKRHGTTVHVGVNFRIGLSKASNTNLQGVARHMVDFGAFGQERVMYQKLPL